MVFIDHQATRDKALISISSALEAKRKRLSRAGVGAEVSSTNDGDEIKLFIRRGRNQVKVEVNHVFRGTVLLRRRLKKELPAALRANQRQFLLGLVIGEPDWNI